MEIIDQVKQAASIVDIASLYTTLKRRGRKHVGLCPFHSEKDPSFTVDAEKQLFHCFGCGVGGDVFTLVMEKENLSFPEALNYLAERFHIPMPQKTRLSPELVKLEEKVFKINDLALGFFRRNLFQTGEGEAALDYLKKRNLSRETLEILKVGYAPNSWNALVSYFQGRGTDPGILEKAGLALPGQKKPEYYDRFRGRVIFPIFSLTGKVLAFGGRTVVSADPKYLNSPDTPVYSKGKVLYGLNWTKEAIQQSEEVILVEGYTDFASLFQAGIRNIAASLGTALTPHQVSLARRFAGSVIINYDGDAAGQNAALRAVPICFEYGIPSRVLVLPQNLDPDGFIRKHGHEAYQKLVNGSIPGLNFLIAAALRTGRMNVPEEKARMVKSVVAEIEKIPDSIVRSEYLRQMSEHFSVDEAMLRLMIEKPAAKRTREEKALLLPAEKRLLQILLGDQGFAPDFLAHTRPEDFSGLKGEPAFLFLLEGCRKGKKPVLSELARAVGPELSRHISELMLEKSRPGTAEEILDCLCSLRKTSLQSQLQALQKEIVRCERNGEKDKLSQLLSQKQNLTRQIISL
jgi:DNA primase